MAWTGFTWMHVPVGHNFHHHFPTSPGFRPGRFDPDGPGARAGVDA